MDAHRSESADVKLERENVLQVLRGDWVAAVRGITLVSVDDNELVIAQDIDQSDVNGVGAAHSGVLYTIADTAAGITANALEPGTQWLTDTATIHHQALAHRGDRLTATSKLVADGDGTRRFETTLRSSAGDVIAILDSVQVRIESEDAEDPA
ncbi:PaaI family thioesterase [Gulosibacter molinativorax]|uniref:PaaI family thioesterase n=1 Tax=Gulosibacter molinativorax TaxID=256821 RepID=UPI000420CB6D|nr:PaaI family thioesterase [Gulosibacter molinativorax]QUY62365.1 Hypotetical protein [Gulosibacter molinativorax]